MRQPAARSEPPRFASTLLIVSAFERERRLRATYDAFNARDIDAVLRQMTRDVDWPNAWEGGRVHGHEGVRTYWTRQSAAIDPTVTPVAFTTRSDGSIAVEVHQVVRDLDGTVLGEGRVLHVYVFRDDRVARNIVDDDPAPLAQWLPAVASTIGAKPPRRLPRWLGRLLAGEPATAMMTEVRGASNAKAKRELG